ncbi:MAG: glycosyltransferase family 2 protein [Caulobacterales bacterium]
MSDPPEPLRVSAVIVSYRTGPALWDCLDSLWQDAAIADIVVVDNGNDSDTVHKLADLARNRRIQLVSGHGNIGFAAGANLGVRSALSDQILFLNPDAAIVSGSAAALVAALHSAKRPSIAGGRLIGKDGKEQRGARRDEVTLWSAFVSFSGLSLFECVSENFRDVNRARDPLPDKSIPVSAVSGALMLISRADFEAIGGFDEGYFLHVEDIDICRRVRAAGGAVIFTPFATARHVGGTSAAPKVLVEWHKARGLWRYFRKFSQGLGSRAIADVFGLALIFALPFRAFILGKR